MKRILDGIARAALMLAAVSLLAIAAVQFWQVFARYVLNDSPGWTEPVALLLMNTAMMCGAAVGVRLDTHFSFTLALDAASPKMQGLLRRLSTLVIGAIGGALAWGGARLMQDDWDVAMAGAAIPEGLRYLPLCVGGGLMTLFALERLIGIARPPVGVDGTSVQTSLDAQQPVPERPSPPQPVQRSLEPPQRAES
jgi:TRAP-type C4-dicarboxylate transport system permease small subunit